MRYFLIPLLLLFPPVFALAGQGKRTIAWEPASVAADGRRHLSFEGACYPDINTLLPNYYELVKIENNSEQEVEIYNKIYEVIDNKELRDIKYLKNLPSKLQVHSKVRISGKQAFLEVQFVPLRRDVASGRVQRLIGFSLRLKPVSRTDHQADRLKSSVSENQLSFASRSVLSSGNWYRISVEKDGVYSLSYDDIRSMGFTDPGSIRIFGNSDGMLPDMVSDSIDDDLVEIPCLDDGNRILFYGRGPDRWKYVATDGMYSRVPHLYSDVSYYYLTTDQGAGLRIEQEEEVQSQAATLVTGYDALYYHELDEENLISSGREWYGEIFDLQTSRDFEFNIPDLVTADSIRVKVRVLAGANSQTSFTVNADGNDIGTIPINRTILSSYTAPAAYPGTGLYTYLPAAQGTDIRITYNKDAPSASGWLDYIIVNARRKLKMTGDQLEFRDAASTGPGKVNEFRIETGAGTVQVWDVTDPDHPWSMKAVPGPSGTVRFLSEASELREFVVFRTGGDHLKPVTDGDGTGIVANQNLHGAGQPDYIVITHPDFATQARRLAAYRHDHDGLDTLVVTPGQIYNEFSAGKPDVAAYRNFIRMFYERAAVEDELPRYLLLFGDGSYDNRGTEPDNTNFILTYQSGNSVSPTASFVTDDFFGLLDPGEGGSTGLVDIGIGRFPVTTLEQAKNVVDKTINYDLPDKMGDWRNTICFIGDDEDGNIHMSQAEELATYVGDHYPAFTIAKIYLDAYKQTSTPSGARYPDVNEALNQRINQGALIVNYTGHGGARGLAHEQILNSNDILSWNNEGWLPLFMTATCEFSRFDDYKETSAGEQVLLNPGGGGIALLSTTRLVYSGPNHALNENFYKYVFELNDQQKERRLGDVIRLTKNVTGTGNQKRNFTLLGDPALELAFPDYKIEATAINGISTDGSTDTLKALGTVSISGKVTDLKGSVLDDFDGILYPTVFDKEEVVRTLANDGGKVFTFRSRNRILYKGKATVSGGRFTFSFVVPKDISYYYDYGKLSFYASGDDHDASGSFDRVLIGGSAGSADLDNEGPDIGIFMNNIYFKSGGITDANPTLLAFFSDSSGINTTGSGIGHDITAVLDGNGNNPIVLNDFYEANTDSYRQGKISYRFKDLGEGLHDLTLKVWDVYNNSSEGHLTFNVTTTGQFILKDVSNYPNPFTDRTSFVFEHNRPDQDLDILIRISTTSGVLVKTIEKHLPASGYRIEPIEWDGRNDYGGRLGRGIYVYRVRVSTDTGETVEKFEKLVILQ